MECHRVVLNPHDSVKSHNAGQIDYVLGRCHDDSVNGKGIATLDDVDKGVPSTF